MSFSKLWGWHLLGNQEHTNLFRAPAHLRRTHIRFGEQVRFMYEKVDESLDDRLRKTTRSHVPDTSRWKPMFQNGKATDGICALLFLPKMELSEFCIQLAMAKTGATSVHPRCHVALDLFLSPSYVSSG